ncbi:hypothetical protein BAE44_0016477 [Dichanthelium oligosanthes]|uniref:Membrane-associated kinase regulator 2 n=1 Tax=Dichanthelium oligosanthes TaxID=888268 RepID=A0A1E5VBH2_9POAL|nr:hypothetical protein BAE44_0016477 [Dichanthelium oligosanthes]
MESFSFLKYLRGGVVAGNQRAPVAATTIAASVCEDGGGGGAVGGGGDVEDDASFFDLEFAVPGDESAASDAEEERVEFNFAVAGDDVASGGAEVVAVDAVAAPAGESGDGKEDAEAETADVAPAPPPASLLRPATKFRVLLLKLRKPKVAVPADVNGGTPAPKQLNRFLIKFRVDEAPLVSLFTRDNSSRTSDAGTCADRPAAAVQAAQQQPQDASAATMTTTITAEERRFAKEVVLKYLSKIKPLYVKVSRRYGERLRFAGGASEGEETDAEPDPSPVPSPSPAPSSRAPTAASAAPAAPQPVVVACGVRAPRASVPAGLKQVCKRLGKSRSASSAVAAAPSPPPAGASGATSQQPQRRDDSLLQLQDGIQSAIAHCKRSFNASKGTTCTATDGPPPSYTAAA